MGCRPSSIVFTVLGIPHAGAFIATTRILLRYAGIDRLQLAQQTPLLCGYPRTQYRRPQLIPMS